MPPTSWPWPSRPTPSCAAPGSWPGSSRLEIRRDNLSAALSWLVEHGSARDGAAPDLGDLAVLVAARPRRGAGPPRGQDPGQQRRPAAAPAGPGPERGRLRPLRRRGPGPGPAAAQAEPAAVPSGRGQAGHGPDRGGPGSPAGARAERRAAPATCSSRPSASCGRWPASADRAGARSSTCWMSPWPSNFLGQIRLGHGDHHRAAELFTDGLSRGPQRGRPVHHPHLALRPGPQPARPGATWTTPPDLLRQGLILAAEAGDEPSLAYYLEALAALAARQDEPGARRLPARRRRRAAARPRAAAGCTPTCHAPPHDDSVLAGLRARTTDAAFQQAWAHGRSLTSTSVIRYALEETTSRPDHRPPPGRQLSRSIHVPRASKTPKER